MEELLKCNYCSRICYNGIDDFKSLIKGSNKILNSCIKCRIDTYKSYKKKYISKEKEKKDLNILYENYKKCKRCNRNCEGLKDFINKDKKYKTCNKCRKITI